jgi:hypothetical protein
MEKSVLAGTLSLYTQVDPWQRFLRKWAILNGSLHANAGHKMATHSKSKTCKTAVDHKPISIQVELG